MVPVTHRSAGRTRLAGGVVNHTHTLTPESSHEAVSSAQGAHRSGLGLLVSIRLKILQRFLDLLLSFSPYSTLNDAFKVIGCFLWHRAVTFDAPFLAGFLSFSPRHLIAPLVVVSGTHHARRSGLGLLEVYADDGAVMGLVVNLDVKLFVYSLSDLVPSVCVPDDNLAIVPVEALDI